jgi:hypothetical protein
MAGQEMRKARGINTLGSKPGFVKGGSSKGKNANGSGTIGGGSKDGGVSLDSGKAGAFPTNFADTVAIPSKVSKSMSQSGSARGRASNNPQSDRAAY